MAVILCITKKPSLLSTFIIGILFVLVGAFLTTVQEGTRRYSAGFAHFWGWIGVIFFGFCTILIGYHLIIKWMGIARLLEYDDNYFYLDGRLPIAWKDIKRFEGSVIMNTPNHNINVIVSNPLKYIHREKSLFRRKLGQINLRLGQPLYYNSAKYEGTQEEQLNELNSILQKRKERMRNKRERLHT